MTKENYYPVYRCPLCDRILRAKPVQLYSDKLPEAIGMVEKAAQFSSNPYLAGFTVPLHILCKCPDGSAGYAIFAGFKKV